MNPTAEQIANAIRLEADERSERQGFKEEHRSAYATGYLLNRLETAIGLLQQIAEAPDHLAAQTVAAAGLRILTPSNQALI